MYVNEEDLIGDEDFNMFGCATRFLFEPGNMDLCSTTRILHLTVLL